MYLVLKCRSKGPLRSSSHCADMAAHLAIMRNIESWLQEQDNLDLRDDMVWLLSQWSSERQAVKKAWHDEYHDRMDGRFPGINPKP